MTSCDPRVLAGGALLAAIGVGLGAFGAHGLRDVLSPVALGWWQTAVDYQMWHAVALVALSVAGMQGLRLPAAKIAAGVLIFSGSV